LETDTLIDEINKEEVIGLAQYYTEFKEESEATKMQPF
jgi:hypothetical protein